ncbi:MAG: zinc ribbon domain-containing protein, partial [Clostridia bacterium]|nr:zinc ribbon domain-containing protein [Clostridia bacterium]
MLSSNSFNLCPHCGNSNTLNARFCSRCGTQLKVPEEVVVCRNCGTRNSPMANFCRNCGSQLKVGEQTKICPRCRNEVPAGDNTCACGYS